MMVELTEREIDSIAEREKRAQRSSRLVFSVSAFVSLLWLVPFYYLAVTIFKSSEEYAQGHPLALPQSLAPFVNNAIVAWTNAKMGIGLLNSAFYGVVGSALAVFIAAMAAYGLSRLEFRGRMMWFMLIFSGTVFPFQMYLVPLFFTYQSFDLLNSRLGMLLFYIAICVPFPVLVLRTHMAQLPRETDEAARMDGCGDWRIFWSIILPNSRGPMVAVFLLQFTWIWNDLLFSTVLANRPEVRSIMVALQVFQGTYATQGANVVLTATLIASLPTIALFFLLRRQFMQGLSVNTL